MTPPTVQFIPAGGPTVARYGVDGDLGSYSSVRFAISNPVETGSDYDWWTRYSYGEFRIISNTQLKWILLQEAGNPYANASAFTAANTLDRIVIEVNGSPISYTSISWIAVGFNLELVMNGSGYTALWSSFSVGDPVSLRLFYS